ncbi:S41 family peptidase [Massilia sp. ST3]|uniref:S41 family peptidase n=1 Tax=Massilia sp. ST3 TaxID=2824903 RepID=UPI001B843288|nr:S41 family peptidase [Massilia sp. ST3]MBQ5946478.1 S41 family peptidase [Massilia sp. ST3]
MKKKWIVIPSLLVLGMASAVAAPPSQPLPGEENRSVSTMVVDRALQVEVIDALVKKLNDHYIFPDKAKQIETALRQRQREGKYDAMSDGKQFAIQLTDDMRAVVRDLHMSVFFSPRPVPADDAAGAPPASQAEWEQRVPADKRQVLRQMAHRSVEQVEHLTPRIGYLKVSGFPPAFLMAESYAAAMNELADTDGLIVDLRNNGGGGADSVSLLVSYFVDQRTRLNDIWDRDTGISTQHWTQDKLDGKRYGGTKPVVILAAAGTKSAGEDFAYTMQAMKRATVVGERTWGGAHPARPYRLSKHFLAVIPDRRTISPITQTNWEGVGVIPDVAAKPDDALAVAKDLLQRRLHGSTPTAAAGQ